MNIQEYLGSGTEEETSRDGLLSSTAEWHALVLGFAVGFMVALTGGKDAAWLFIIFSGVAFGSKQTNIEALQNLKREPIYGLLASVLGFLITAFLIVPQLPSGI